MNPGLWICPIDLFIEDHNSSGLRFDSNRKNEMGCMYQFYSCNNFNNFKNLDSMYHKLMGKWGGKIRMKLDLLAGMQYSLGSWNSSLIRRKK
jgi:hypothetical protein